MTKSETTYLVTAGDVLVPDCDYHLISDVFYVNSEGFVPLGSLASFIYVLGAELLLAGFNLTPGVHLAEPLGVAGELSFDHCKLELARSCLLNHLSFLLSFFSEKIFLIIIFSGSVEL